MVCSVRLLVRYWWLLEILSPQMGIFPRLSVSGNILNFGEIVNSHLTVSNYLNSKPIPSGIRPVESQGLRWNVPRTPWTGPPVSTLLLNPGYATYRIYTAVKWHSAVNHISQVLGPWPKSVRMNARCHGVVSPAILRYVTPWLHHLCSGVAMDCAACAKHRGPRAWGAHLSWLAELIFKKKLVQLLR